MMPPIELVALLRAGLPGAPVLDAPADLQHYGRDWTRHWVPAPGAVVLPRTIEEVQRLVVLARRHGFALVPSGGRTGLSGGAVAADGEVVVALDRMNRILAFDAADRTLTVQAGVVTAAVQQAAQAQGLFYPVDFGSRGSSQIGGNVATNAGGIRVLRYGMTRQWVTGLKVVTGAGDVLDLNRGLAKNATGYDLRHLFIGSEGTLGICVEATLQLAPAPAEQQVMLLGVPALDLLLPVLAHVRARLVPSAFEFFSDRALHHVMQAGARQPLEQRSPFYAVVEFDRDEEAALACYAALSDAGLVTDGVIARSTQHAAELWRCREGITESIARFAPYKNDIAVRIGAAPAFLAAAERMFAREYPQFEVIWFGHLGDGNLHLSVLKPADMDAAPFQAHCDHVTGLLADLLAAHGGSISAEHGIGLLKKPWLASSRSEAEIALMRQIRRLFDPDGIMNPGKLVDARH